MTQQPLGDQTRRRAAGTEQCTDKRGIDASHLSAGQWGQKLKIILSNESTYNDSLVCGRGSSHRTVAQEIRHWAK